MKTIMKSIKKPVKVLRRLNFPLVDFSRNEQIIQTIFIEQFNQLTDRYRQLESEVEMCDTKIARLENTVNSHESTIASQLSTISTHATTIL